MTKGIDVSTHQGNIDWNKVKSDAVKFAIIRAGYGRESSQKDVFFEKNYAGCKSNAISVGAYWYSYALTPEQAKKEAATCIKAIENKTFEYPIYFDIENKTQLALSEDLLQRIAIAFCDELESAGYWVGIYSYKNRLDTNTANPIDAQHIYCQTVTRHKHIQNNYHLNFSSFCFIYFFFTISKSYDILQIIAYNYVN